jgi:hypothetical protein
MSDSDNGFTPEPWYWINQIGGGPALVHGQGEDDGGVVAESMGRSGIVVWNDCDKPMLASAPTLYAALERATAELQRRMVDEGCMDRDDDKLLADCEAALKQARGGGE